MRQKKKAYQRFEDLTRKAMTPAAGEATDDSSLLEPAAPETVTIELTPELGRALARRAAVDDKAPSAILEEALRRYLQTWN